MGSWRVVAAAAAVVVSLLTACGGDPSALDPRGPAAHDIAVLWWVMLALGTAVYGIFLVLLVRSIVASRHRREREEGVAVDETGDRSERFGHRLILAGGVVLPLVVLLPLAVLTMRTGSKVAFRSDPSHLAVEVIGHQFWWEVRYPQHGAVTANEIHIPVGTTVDLTLRSDDVIHSFWVPRLAGKVDSVPGQVTALHLRADEPGVYRGLCAEYCGIQHANMQFLVVARPEPEFRTWVAGQASERRPPRDASAAEGERVFNAAGCGACHSVRGTEAVGTRGPDLTHFATRRTIGAATVENNRGNLGGWIANPQSIKPGAKMPPTPLSGDELLALIAYVEGLG